MTDLFLIGAGGHCVSCLDVIKAEGKYRIQGIFDLPEKVGTKVLDVPVIGEDSDIGKFIKDGNRFLITLGQIKSPQRRMALFKMLSDLGAEFATVISPRAYVSPYASIGKGTIVMHDALVNANAKVLENCIINTKALIEHDSEIGAHCHISTGTVVNGGCSVGEGSFIGSNAVLKEALNVPTLSVLAAGGFYR
ncbi:MAG: NeuD/PglB/VioB family sugar acetyltransferase [Bdellovibrio sp.]